MVTFDTSLVLSLVLSTIIPLISSLITKAHWPSVVAGIVTLFISGANGFFTEWSLSPHDYQWQSALLLALASFVIAAIGRVVLWKDTELDNKLVAIGSGTPSDPAVVTNLPAAPVLQAAPAPVVDQNVPVDPNALTGVDLPAQS